MFINEEHYYRDLSGSFHPKTDVYYHAHDMALFGTRYPESKEHFEIIIGSLAGVAHLLTGEERDSYFGMLDGMAKGPSTIGDWTGGL